MTEETKTVTLVFLRSVDGRSDWELVKPEDVPEWVKDEENMAQLLEGECCCKCDEGVNGSDWYCARQPAEAVAILAAQEKRKRKSALRVAAVRRENRASA